MASGLKDREEIFTLTAFKRKIAQFATTDELEDAIVGVVKGVRSEL
jgi:hypothetical protein